MTGGGDAILRLPARGLEELLGELEEARQSLLGADHEIQLPRVTLLLGAGHAVTGEFLRFAAEVPAGEPMVLVRDELGGGGHDVSYVPLSRVHALRVHFAPENIHLLGFGVVKPPLGRVPGRLELERRARDIGAFLEERVGHPLPVEVAWDELPRSDESMASMARLLGDLREALHQLTGDDLGAQALGERVETLRIVTSDDARVVLRGRTLKLEVHLVDGDLQTLSGRALTTAIEGLL